MDSRKLKALLTSILDLKANTQSYGMKAGPENELEPALLVEKKLFGSGHPSIQTSTCPRFCIGKKLGILVCVYCV